MKRKLLLALCLIFVVILGLGLSFMEYNIMELNPNIILSMVLIGGIGTTILVVKIAKE